MSYQLTFKTHVDMEEYFQKFGIGNGLFQVRVLNPSQVFTKEDIQILLKKINIENLKSEINDVNFEIKKSCVNKLPAVQIFLATFDKGGQIPA